jgi:hypothetical protein
VLSALRPRRVFEKEKPGEPNLTKYCYRTSRNEVPSDSALIPFGGKGFTGSLAVTPFGDLL